MDTVPGRDDTADTTVLAAQLVRMGLAGAHFADILETFGTGVNAAGIPLMRAHVTLRAHHPEYGSLSHRWHRQDGIVSESYEHTDELRGNWLASPLYHLLAHDISELRVSLRDTPADMEFEVFDDLRAQGGTEYLALKTFFYDPGDSLAVDPDSPPEGSLISLTSDGPDGFSDVQADALRQLLPVLKLALKSGANRRMASDIADIYLGRDAGSRVLSGDILRGSVRRLDAVICYFDLSGFTRLSETLSGPDIIAMLNDYFGVAVDVVQNHGGNVLKFMGDGMLAIFDVTTNEDAGASAVQATVALREELALISKQRSDKGLTATGFTVALHSGEVLYGNIGGRTRLDFTVIGPAVNTAARLSGMCAHVDQNIVISATVARPLLTRRNDLVSLGQYRLRGVAERQELFTLD
ncbi:adenylate/guanylate cyclase domain-containing protein [uncultured Roseobacter sp.]|uniref:adenylate/guanylate cyclase domain-containing protein n=1 Tax=uncultured Roseobacter sp. TaxID=114847 RepID=UPI0026368F64|nr:adenylate/guanylate cyclase domain-containing protein [uncultured Roseobacter sp.]